MLLFLLCCVIGSLAYTFIMLQTVLSLNVSLRYTTFLKNNGSQGDYKKIYFRIFLTIILSTTIFLTLFLLVSLVLNGMNGFICGVVEGIFRSRKRIGMNQDNINDYLQTYQKYYTHVCTEAEHHCETNEDNTTYSFQSEEFSGNTGISQSDNSSDAKEISTATTKNKLSKKFPKIILFLFGSLVLVFVGYAVGVFSNKAEPGTDFESTWGKLIELNNGELIYETLTPTQQSLVNYPKLDKRKVYFVKDGTSYHSVDWCYTLDNVTTLYYNNIDVAVFKGMEPCSKCVGDYTHHSIFFQDKYEDDKCIEYYFVTERGESYHTKKCNFIVNGADYNIKKISLYRAIQQGYTACDKCVNK